MRDAFRTYSLAYMLAMMQLRMNRSYLQNLEMAKEHERQAQDLACLVVKDCHGPYVAWLFTRGSGIK